MEEEEEEEEEVEVVEVEEVSIGSQAAVFLCLISTRLDPIYAADQLTTRWRKALYVQLLCRRLRPHLIARLPAFN